MERRRPSRNSSLGSLGASTIASGAAASQAATSQAAARTLSHTPKPGSPSSPTSPASPARKRLEDRRDALKSQSLPQLPNLKQAPPETIGPPKEGIFSRNWTSEHKRLLHEQSERHWLRAKNKHSYIDFSDAERAELRKYFDALANGDPTVDLPRLENMLISLGLATTQQEVKRIVDSIDTNGNGELDFEEYLEIFRKRTDSEIFQVFKEMMEGKLGDQNLGFQTVISTHRRNLFLKATGGCRRCGGWNRCSSACKEADREIRLGSDSRPVATEVEHGTRILHNFASLQRNRYTALVAASEGPEGVQLDKDAMSFDPFGDIPLGSLAISWRGVTHDHGLVSSRPSSADRSKRTVPESPRTVISTVVKIPKPIKRNGPHGATIIIQAPALEDTSARRSPTRSPSRSPQHGSPGRLGPRPDAGLFATQLPA